MTISSAVFDSASAVKLRDGSISDCNIIAELINASAEGAAEYLFADISAAITPIEYLANLLEQEVYYSYANTIVAEVEDNIVGMALSFPSEGLVCPQMENQYSEQQLLYIQSFVEHKIAESWHLDALCVLPKFRNSGIGSRLLAAVKTKAQEYNFASVGVFVFASNDAALRFYRRHGFDHRADIDTQAQEFLRTRNGLHLMECRI